MDIKPVHPTPPAAPLHKVAEQKDMRREQRSKQQHGQQRPPGPEQADDGHHIDAYA